MSKKFIEILFLIIFTLSTSNTYAVKIKINKEKTTEAKHIQDINPRDIIFSYHSIEINGRSYNTLRHGVLSDHQEGESLEFEVNGYVLPLPKEINDRIFKIILNGWESVIEFFPVGLLSMPGQKHERFLNAKTAKKRV